MPSGFPLRLAGGGGESLQRGDFIARPAFSDEPAVAALFTHPRLGSSSARCPGGCPGNQRAARPDKAVLMMGNHGVLVVGGTVAEAFDLLYSLERACRTLVLAYSTGRPL